MKTIKARIRRGLLISESLRLSTSGPSVRTGRMGRHAPRSAAHDVNIVRGCVETCEDTGRSRMANPLLDAGNARRDAPSFDRRRMRRGAAAFALLSIAGLIVLFVTGTRGFVDSRQMFPPLHLGFLTLACLCAVADIVLGALRYQLFLRTLRPRHSLALPIRADLAGRFVAAVTPSQSGGGPAQVYVLHRAGIPIPVSLSFLLINLLCTLAVGLMAGGFSAWLFHGRFPDGAMLALIRYGGAAMLGLWCVMALALVRPDLVVRQLERLTRRESPSPGMIARAARTMADCVVQYRRACDEFIRRRPLLPVASLALTVVIYLNKFGLAWLVIRGLGASCDFPTTLAVMALTHFSVFMAPTPGGSGIAEVATGAFATLLMPASLVGAFTLLYRALLIYAPAVVGAVILLAELNDAGSHEARPIAVPEPTS